MLLKLDGITKTYAGRDGQVRALEDASLQIEPGQFVAVQGPSGCGKSTMLLIAGGLLKPDRGTVQIDGSDPYRLSPEDRAKFRAVHLGFVFQQFHLVPYLSVVENVLTPSLAAPLQDAPRRADELLERFGIAHRRNHLPGQLSTGERQRAALARALLARPKLLLADEPTGNLDADNTETVMGYLSEFARDGGGVMLVTHDTQAAGHAQTAIRLEAGRICQPAGAGEQA